MEASRLHAQEEDGESSEPFLDGMEDLSKLEEEGSTTDTANAGGTQEIRCLKLIDVEAG